MSWELVINLHWPHDRFVLGWEYISPDEEHNFSTYTMYLFIMTLQLHVYE